MTEQTHYDHDKKPAIGVLLVNLGTPQAPTPKAVRRYLAEFLSDPRVVNIPTWLWKIILHGVILRTRPKASARLYQNIWTSEGSPLMINSVLQTEALSLKLPAQYKLALAMRYGNPSIKSALETLRKAQVKQLIVLPLYPQYTAVTTGSVFDAVTDILQTWRWIPELRFISNYADHPDYIAALVHSIQSHWQQHGRAKKLLLSYHGIPKINTEKGDPYYCYCHKTTRMVVEQLQLKEHQWQMVFQSRFGRAKWLQPYCVEVLEQLPQQGIKEIDIVCPGFSADCLETLEEIAITNKKIFLEKGGEKLNYIPALNANDKHITALASIINAS